MRQQEGGKLNLWLVNLSPFLKPVLGFSYISKFVCVRICWGGGRGEILRGCFMEWEERVRYKEGKAEHRDAVIHSLYQCNGTSFCQLP